MQGFIMLSTVAGLMAWNAMGFNPFSNGSISLRGMNDEQLRVLSAQTGVSYGLLRTQQRAEMASAGSTGDIGEEQLIPTVEIQLKSNPKKPHKARKQNIKMLRKALRPPNYNLGLFKIYRYNAAHECACCGVDIRRFLEGDNAYAHIVDERTSLSLADIYWFDEDTGNAKKPLARTHGDHGDEMNSTLCPAHLHIFHTLRSIIQEKEMADDGFARVASKGTKFTRIPGMSTLMGSAPKNRSTAESLMKYEPFFDMVHKDSQHSKGVSLQQLPNPVTGVVDIVTITFDLRAIQSETMLAQRNAMGMGPNMQSQMNNAIMASSNAIPTEV
tara:strand:+ start:9314 stop:10297 length:984 start_codon:yes stop_codon:yes gene_type:complete